MLFYFSVTELFERAAKAVAGVVDDYVYAVEVAECDCEGVLDRGGFGDVKFDGEVVFGIGVGEREGSRVARCGYADVAIVNAVGVAYISNWLFRW